MTWKVTRYCRARNAPVAHPRVQLAARSCVERLETRLFLSTSDATLLADASVRNDLYANVNFGAATHLFVQTPVTAAADTQIAFLKFDVSQAATVSSAVLQITALLAAKSDPAIDTQVFAVADTAWTEGSGTGLLASLPNGITWNTQPAIGIAISGVETTSTNTATAESFDITGYVQQQKLLGDDVISIAIESTTQGSGLPPGQQKKAGAGIVEFDSKESAVKPALVIQSATVAPKATLHAANVTAAKTNETVVAEYSGSSAINLNTIVGGAAGNLTITGPPAGPPAGPSAAAIGAVTIDATNPDDVFATYAIIPPNGSAWSFSNNGTYTVKLKAGQVKDITGLAAASVSTTFRVNVPLPDTTPPAAKINSATISIASFAPQQITVVYTDNVAVDAAKIATSNISVTGPSGTLTVESVAKSSTANAATITATYSVDAPGSGWSYLDNGSYTVSLLARQVTDTSANSAAAISSTLVVNIAPPANPADLTFNNGASLSIPFAAEASAILPDGEIVVVGNKGDLGAGTSQGVIELLSGDGSVNTSFGAGGFVTTAASDNDALYSVVPQGGGFIVGGSAAGGEFLLQRYLLSGTPDPTFGQGGSVATNFGSSAQAVYSLALSPTGSILAGGTAAGNFAFADYDTSGNLVSTWGQSGRQLFDLGSNIDVVGKVAFQSNGDLIAVGSTDAQVAIVRLNTAGIADPSFGANGLVIVPGLAANTAFTAGDRTEGLAIESDDSILVANQTANGHFGVAHLDANGNVITSFGTNGLATASFGSADDPDSVFVQPDGTIVAIGTTSGPSGVSTAIAEFDANGALIPTFGLLGEMTIGNSPGLSNALVAAAGATATFASQSPDGRILIGTFSGESQAAIQRLTLGGTSSVSSTPLGSFGPAGRKNLKLTVPVNGVQVTLSVLGGTGEAFMNSAGLNLSITAGSRGATLIIKLAGGNQRVALAGLAVTGSLRALTNRSVDLSGTLSATGMIGNLSLGNVTGGDITAGSNINAVSLLGATNSTVSVGAQGRIRNIHVRTIDTLTRFLAGSFGAAMIPKSVKTSSDPHFQTL
jgi:uncharacterized delta-60 repeat protein